MKKSIAMLVALFTILLASPASAQDATIMLAHGIPDTDVDVVVDGSVVIDGFSFGDMEDLSAFAGQTLTGLTVNLAGTDTVALDLGDFAVPAAGNFTVVAHLDADGNPSASVFENDTSTIAAGEGRLVVRHTAAAPAVDVLANGAAAFTNVSNGDEGQADLAAGTISAEVVPTGTTTPVVIGPADLPITEGASLIVYAVGSLDADNLSVLTQNITGLGSTPSVVNTGNSPVDNGGASTLAIVSIAVVALLALGLGARRLATVQG
ncbi:MAG: DUF4397 domain-containing protein [Acidimicrobiia bacterium]|nr:DUF4397 domain-containing protein [Acidimicrobiia bacterium]